jgi:hypothetical protein
MTVTRTPISFITMLASFVVLVARNFESLLYLAWSGVKHAEFPAVLIDLISMPYSQSALSLAQIFSFPKGCAQIKSRGFPNKPSF